MDLTVTHNLAATPTSRVVRLGLDGASFAYEAGQAAWLSQTPDGELTPYSLASWPAETERRGFLEFLVKVDGSSRFGASVASLETGARVRVQGPAGTFVLPPGFDAARLTFIAGGTGIAPLRSMIRQATEAGVERTPRLLYSARSPEEFAYLDELVTLSRDGALEVNLTLTGENPDWVHGRGRIDRTVLARLADDTDVMAFICGPPAMLTEVSTSLSDLGLSRDRIRTETW
jgi:NAD(P)H-flavin reductase